ncbi:unnamed protein product [Urochloa humidicola]
MAGDAHHPSRGRAMLLLLLFVLQIPSLLGSRSAYAPGAVVVDPAAATAEAGGRRLLGPVPAVHHEQQSVEVVVRGNVAPHPRSVKRRGRRSGGGGGSAFMNAASKHQVPSGANPDSN